VFKKRTLFVVGAGASYEMGLPTGKQLAATIKQKMDVPFADGYKPSGSGDYDLLEQLTNKTRIEKSTLQAAAFLIGGGIETKLTCVDLFDHFAKSLSAGR
jgi:hypothetical protein